ncbi:prolipoprotein diacylglyceryl transferase [Chengkuizengella marina]|uniref:hypothetical protein n=1 Tax=Chengkuizengella marina TaxID=2507566 RepID=UPI00191C46C2|nr:hypothetical protein [Chengkuizengella marina]
MNGDAFGSPTNSGFGIVYPEGTMAYDRYGSQPLWPSWPTGFIFLFYNILFSIGRFSLELD